MGRLREKRGWEVGFSRWWELGTLRSERLLRKLSEDSGGGAGTQEKWGGKSVGKREWEIGIPRQWEPGISLSEPLLPKLCVDSGGQEPRRNGGGKSMGKEGVGGGIPKGAGAGRNGKSLHHCTTFGSRKSTRWREPEGGGNRECKVREAGDVRPPPPPPLPLASNISDTPGSVIKVQL